MMHTSPASLPTQAKHTVVKAAFLGLCFLVPSLGTTNSTTTAESIVEIQATEPELVALATPAPPIAAAAATLPSDRYARQQWSLQGNYQHLGASGLFDSQEYLASATEVVVAVVDSGVILDHEDLHFLPGYDFIHDSNVANDGDGRDHDPSDTGDWVSQSDLDQSIVNPGCPLTDSKWHGTAISGIIGATSHNATGIAGGSTAVALLPVRVTGKCGGYVADLIDGIRWSAGLTVMGVADNPHPAQVINLSVGFPGSCSNAMQNAVNDAINTGAIIVTAATNTAVDLDSVPYSPASCDNVITVAATDREGLIAPYSALGKSVFISAPGGTITDGIITTQNDGTELPVARSSYGYHYGTSIAAAHVSASIANLLSYQPDLTKKQVEQLLSLSVSSTEDDERCNTGQCGLGRLNAAVALAYLEADLLPIEGEAEPTDVIPVQLAAISTEPSNDATITTPTGGNSGAGSIDLKILFLLFLASAYRAVIYRAIPQKLLAT